MEKCKCECIKFQWMTLTGRPRMNLVSVLVESLYTISLASMAFAMDLTSETLHWSKGLYLRLVRGLRMVISSSLVIGGPISQTLIFR